MELADGALPGAQVEGPRPAAAPKLVERQSLGQLELWEVIVSFATGVASSAAYDAIEALLAGHRDVARVEQLADTATSSAAPQIEAASSAGESETYDITWHFPTSR
jgi:hypothetical protein